MSTDQTRTKFAKSACWLAHGIHDTATIGFIVLAVLLAGFAVFVLPKGSEFHKAAQMKRDQDISNENKATCEKWGMKFGTPEYIACTMDLNDIRAKQEQRVNADMMGLL